MHSTTNNSTNSDKMQIKDSNIIEALRGKRVLLTGGAGFIGHHLAEAFLSIPDLVLTVVDNLLTGDIKRLEKHMDNSRFHWVLGDLRDLNLCKELCAKNDIICHQAALGSVPRSLEFPANTHDHNVNGFMNVLVAAYENKIEKIVFASSSSVYGDHPELPKTEGKEGNLLSPYALSKASNEAYAKVFSSCYGTETIGLRYFNIFGPGQSPDGPYAAVIPKFMQALKEGRALEIYGDGEQSRDFTYVDNAVLANLLALSRPVNHSNAEVMNIAAGDRTTLNQLSQYLIESSGIPVEVKYQAPRKGDILHSLASTSKAQASIDFKVIVDFKTGVYNTWKAFNS